MRRVIFFCFVFSFVTAYAKKPVVLIAYYSATGHTKSLAEQIAVGAKKIKGIEVLVQPISSVSNKVLSQAQTIIVGSPVYNGNMAPQVQSFINQWPFDGTMKNKLGGAFVTAGGYFAGQESAKFGILRSMLMYQMIVAGGDNWYQAYGSTKVTGRNAIKKINGFMDKQPQRFGKRMAQLTLKILGITQVPAK